MTAVPSSDDLATLRDWWRGQYPHESTKGSVEEQEAQFQEFLGEYWLNLRGHKLTHLPEAFGVLSKLRRLDLIGNRLEALPERMGELCSLEDLDIDDSRFTRLPASFSRLGRLKRCYVHAALTELPDDFGQLQALESLDLRGNALTHLPDSMRHLRKLQRLKLNRNQLSALPDWLCELPALTHLDARGNPFRNVPSGLGQCPNLQFLGVDAGVPSPDLARWHRMRQEPLGEIQVTFSKILGELGHELPTDAARFRQNGSVGPEEGDYGYFDTVHYRFGRDESGEFLDWHTEHRIWGDRCGRIREDGSEESSEPCFYCEG
jgi:hypothetical protein